MSRKAIDLPRAIINLEFRVGILEGIVSQLVTVAPPNSITEDVVQNVRAAVFQQLRAKYPDAGLAWTAEDAAPIQTFGSTLEPIFLTLHGNSVSAGRLDLTLQNAGTAFNIIKFEATTPGCRVVQWHPRSLPEGALLRAPTDLPPGSLSACRYEMRISDRRSVERRFEILVDPRSSPAEYEFIERSSEPQA